MIRNFFRDGLHWMAIVGVILGAAVWFSPQSQASPVDESAYLETLDYFGIQYPSRDYALTAGRAICFDLNKGTNPIALARAIADPPRLAIEDANHLVGASIGALCPWNAILPALGSVAA